MEANNNTRTEDMDNEDMGNQSQLRKSGNRKSKERPKHIVVDNANKKKLLQQPIIAGLTAFRPNEHCQICKAQLLGLTVPKRAHNPKCAKNTKTLGFKSARSLEVEKVAKENIEKNNRPLQPAGTLEVEAAAKKLNIEKNNLPLQPARTLEVEAAAKKLLADTIRPLSIAEKGRTVGDAPLFAPKKKTTSTMAPANSIEKGDKSSSNTTKRDKSSSTTTTADDGCSLSSSFLSDYVEGMMQIDPLKKTALTAPARGACPEALLHIARFIKDNYFPPRLTGGSIGIPDTRLAKAAMIRYEQVFPSGSIEFSVPRASRLETPNPNYHAIEGVKLLFVHWEVNFPGIKLTCPDVDCGGELVRDRSELSKKATLFPIFDAGRPTMYADIMVYRCDCCKQRVPGNSGKLLYSLPPHVRDAYPVHPRYAVGTFHLSRQLTDELDEVMVTYGNGEFFSRSLYQRLNQQYFNRVDTYYAQCKYLKVQKSKPYPTLEDWVGRFYPNGAKFRELYEVGQRSTLTRSGISDYERQTRELQSVKCQLTCAQDHTFEVSKNYRSSLGAKACWTCCVETGEIAAACLVDNTKVTQFAHAAEQLARRNNFKPKVMYADTWPNLETFWALLFGTLMVGRLGLYHFMQRIIKTMRDSHVDYRLAIWKLTACFYEYDEGDETKVTRALKSGKLSKEGLKYSEKEVMELKYSGRWKQRYEKHLRKITFTSARMVENLKQWKIRFKVEGSPEEPPGRGRKDPFTDKKLFTLDTAKAVEEGIKSCEYIGDILPLDDMYTVLPATFNSTHGLQEYISHRVESRLEQFHGPLANYGNSNMNPGLADTLHLTGTAKYNVTIRQKLKVRAMSQSQRYAIPWYFINVPPFFNHSSLAAVNQDAAAAGVPDELLPFKDLRPLPPDNGERFFSEYLQEQRKRNIIIEKHPNNDRCQCGRCGSNPKRLFHELVADGKTVYNPYTKTRTEITTTTPVAVATTKRKRPKLVDIAPKPKMVTSLPPSVVPQQLPTFGFPGSFGVPFPPFGFYSKPQIFPQPTMPWINNTVSNQPMSLAVLPSLPRSPRKMPPRPKPKKRKLQADWCCQPYYQWCCRVDRNGRPPHHPMCTVGQANKKAKV
jgi:hypothetical protein